ncbi:hypothetical protein [Streptomyces sp. NBC_00690]|uniref:hypothetical protein n=1 Tax=Streptomyces sp. NBC_00690 TaxID=2975808 RepID=UPI002E296FA4|nr:hypothetical protein [Streptomyces sp. NBC_00690]
MSDKTAPEVGTLALDSKTNRVGRVMGHVGTHVQLRRPEGGIEWDARPEDVRTVEASEYLRLRVAERNATSGGVL